MNNIERKRAQDLMMMSSMESWTLEEQEEVACLLEKALEEVERVEDLQDRIATLLDLIEMWEKAALRAKRALTWDER